jgi:hypothetical protein
MRMFGEGEVERPSRDGHQFHRPSRTAADGTSSVRTTNVSISTPRARPSPMNRSWPPMTAPPARAKTPNVPARMRPAEVTVGPVRPMARTTASRTGRCPASSRIRVMIRML